jgi:hypothetical protein
MPPPKQILDLIANAAELARQRYPYHCGPRLELFVAYLSGSLRGGTNSTETTLGEQLLRLLKDDSVPAASGPQPGSPEHDVVRPADAAAGMTWWNSLSESARAYWLRAAGSATAADAWRVYQACVQRDKTPDSPPPTTQQ